MCKCWFELLKSYLLGATCSSLSTLPAPAISVALDSMVCFSSSDFTGPFRVTAPFCEMILTLCAVVESDLSFTIARRMCAVSWRSLVFSFCWSAVGSFALRSRWLILVLSAGAWVFSAGACDAPLLSLRPEQAHAA